MKSYGQFCSVARALDAVGDRWVLLIVRELLALGPSRYSDLKRGLPGIASNLLSERLKTMEAESLVERYDAPPPIGTTLYRLTDRGLELRDVVHALARWGLDRMYGGAGADAAQPQWSALFAALELSPHLGPETEFVLGLHTGDETVHAILRHGAFEIRRGPAPDADVTLTGDATLVGAVLSGYLTTDEAADLGLRIDGTPALLTDLMHSAPQPSPRPGATP
jgi:DNA-binding HxlR family transcriptional regulator